MPKSRSGLPPSRIRLDGPAELVAAVPYLLGFHPERSLVAVGLAGRPAEVVLCARADLPRREAAAVTGARLAAQVRRAGGTHAVLIGYPGARQRDRAVIAAAARAFEGAGIVVLDRLRVVDGRFWSYLCGDPECCPPAGRPVGLGGVTPLAAAMVVAGRRVLAGRSELVAVLDAGRPADTALLHAEFAAAEERLRDHIAREGLAAALRPALGQIRAAARHGEPPDSADAVRWCVALVHSSVLGACVREVGAGLMTRADAAERLWLELVRIAVAPYGCGPACLLALHAYARGDGAFARVCTERALAHDPESPLARDLLALLECGVHPDRLRSALGAAGGPA